MENSKSITGIILLAIGFLAVSNPAIAKKPMRITTEENVVSVYAGDNVLLRYRYENVPFKPYVQQLFSPRGINVLRDAPSDHLHHHSLMFAVAVDGVNFWEEHLQPGQQKHLSFTVHIHMGKTGSNTKYLTGFSENLEWINPRSGDVLLKELRTIKGRRFKEFEANILTWESKLSVPTGKESVTLTGSRYFGLGMRFTKSMDVRGEFRDAFGNSGVKETNDEQSRWCSYTASANGKLVTIAMFDDPNNPRHPARWFTMEKPFAYLSATLNLHREPLKIEAGKPLVLRYGVAVWDGRVESNRIEKLCRKWNSKVIVLRNLK